MEYRVGKDAELALEGPAIECLREVREDELGAYGKTWRVLAHRFGHLDEPERATRRFDSRKQLDGESITEYEQPLRTLYREAWPRADETTKDSALKRKFEDGLTSAEMLQFLRLHARTDDFAQTVAKARRFAETQEAVTHSLTYLLTYFLLACLLTCLLAYLLTFILTTYRPVSYTHLTLPTIYSV